MSKIIKTNGIALLQRKYSETSIIASVYTADHGRQTFYIAGARKPKAPIRASLFAPLSLLAIEQYRNEKGGLQKCKEVHLLYPLPNLRMDIVKSSVSLFLAELLGQVLREEHSNEPLFEFVEHSVHLLDQLHEGVANFHLVFMLELTRFLGFYPQDNFSIDYPLFDMQNGCYVPSQTAASLPAHQSLLVAELQSSSLRSIGELQLSHGQRTSLLKALLDYYRWHIHGMQDIHSAEVLADVFA